MKRLLILAVLVFGSKSNALVTSVELPSGTYGLKEDFIRRGDFSLYLQNSYPLGQLKPPATTQGSANSANELRSMFESDIQDSHKNINAVDKFLDTSQKGMDSDKVTLPSQVETKAKPEASAPIDFDRCLDDALFLLKRKLQLAFVTADQGASSEEMIEAARSLEVIDARLLPFRGAAGMVCGKGNRFLENAKVTDAVTQIKILAALKTRASAERERLMQATALAYGPLTNEKIRGTWLVIWNRLTLLAVFKSAPLASSKEIVSELVSAASSETTQITQGRVNLSATVTADNAHYEADLAEGEKFLETTYGEK